MKQANSYLETQKKLTLKSILGQNSGQLILEYILLIFIVVTIATLLSKSLVGRSEGGSGIIINQWARMTELVAQDMGD